MSPVNPTTGNAERDGRVMTVPDMLLVQARKVLDHLEQQAQRVPYSPLSHAWYTAPGLVADDGFPETDAVHIYFRAGHGSTKLGQPKAVNPRKDRVGETMANQIRVESYNGVRYEWPGTLIMVTVCCAQCALIFGIPDLLDKQLRREGTGFYCPHGHSLTYGETEVDKLQRHLADAREDARSAYASVEIERRRHAATKGQLTKARKRAAAGVCPCCHRTFKQVARHMASQHPDYQTAVS